MLNNYYSSEINHFFLKKLNLYTDLTVNYFILKLQKFLVFNSQKFNKKVYFLLPANIKIYYKKKYIYFIVTNSFFCKYQIFNFFFNLNYFLRELKFMSFKTMFVKGNNLKITFLDNLLSSLKLKLGYSHLIFLNIPKYIHIKLFKRKLIIKCFSKVLLGNFCTKLFNYKPINIFTGKGLLIKRRKKFKLKYYSKKI